MTNKTYNKVHIYPVRLPPHLYEQIKERANADMKTASEWIRDALRQRIDREDRRAA